MRILLATGSEPFIRGGAEILVDSLRRQLESAGHELDVLAIPFPVTTVDEVLRSIIAAPLIDVGPPVSDLLIAVKFPAYLLSHPNKVLWLCHQHRPATDLWKHRWGMSNEAAGLMAKAAIEDADRRAVTEARKVFTIADTVCERLSQSIGFHAPVLIPPPPLADRLHCEDDHDYFFYPSRLSPLKRHEMVLEALSLTREPVKVRFAGQADWPKFGQELKARAKELGVSRRVEWLGWIDDSQLVENYARSRAVVFTPEDEDLGFVALEAMLSRKPMLTCTDSGEPARLVVHGETGFVSDPEPAAMARKLDLLWRDRETARRMGVAGLSRYRRMGCSWPRIAEKLLS